jgi:hypothetical protein
MRVARRTSSERPDKKKMAGGAITAHSRRTAQQRNGVALVQGAHCVRPEPPLNAPTEEACGRAKTSSVHPDKEKARDGSTAKDTESPSLPVGAAPLGRPGHIDQGRAGERFAAVREHIGRVTFHVNIHAIALPARFFSVRFRIKMTNIRAFHFLLIFLRNFSLFENDAPCIFPLFVIG